MRGDRRVGIGQLVEEERRAIGGDRGDVDGREPAGRNAIRLVFFKRLGCRRSRLTSQIRDRWIVITFAGNRFRVRF